MRVLFSILTLALLQLSYAQHQPILISQASGICEPSIKLDPREPNRLVVGAVLDYVFYSEDTGRTWMSDRLKSDYGVWGDPVIEVDTAGNFYYFHLANPPEGEWIDRIVCQRSSDGGETWSRGTFTGLNGTKEQDKHWSAVDPATNTIHVTWTEFDEYGSEREDCMSRIRYAKSEDQGETWFEASVISSVPGDCKDDDDTVEGAVPAIGPEGAVYVAWAGPTGLSFKSSKDRGSTWSAEAMIDPMPGGWTYDVPGIFRANGLPITKCDLSGGEHHGRIYVNWSDQRAGITDTNVWLSYSDNEGKTWSKARRVNQDKSNRHQFFTWMDIDQSSGTLYFVYYDRRNIVKEQPLATQVYMAMSIDGGEHFVDFPVDTGNYFVPTPSVFFGDYNNVTAHGDVVRPIWTRLHNGELSIWTSIINTEQLSPRLIHVSPSFSLGSKEKLTFKICKNGKLKEKVWTKVLEPGDYTLPYIWEAEGQSAGVYTMTVSRGKNTLWSKEIRLENENE